MVKWGIPKAINVSMPISRGCSRVQISKNKAREAPSLYRSRRCDTRCNTITLFICYRIQYLKSRRHCYHVSESLRSDGVARSGAFRWVHWRQPKRKKNLAWEAALWILVERVVYRPKHSVDASALTGTLQLRYRHELLHFVCRW